MQVSKYFLGPQWWMFFVFFNAVSFLTLYPLQEAGFTGFMRNLRGRDQEKVGKRKEEL